MVSRDCLAPPTSRACSTAYACVGTSPHFFSSASSISPVATVIKQSPYLEAEHSRSHSRAGLKSSSSVRYCSGIHPVSANMSIPELLPGKS